MENWVVAHSASVLTDGAATLLNRTTGGLSSLDVAFTHPSLADKAELTVGEKLLRAFPTQDMHLLYRIRRVNKAAISTAAKQVGKPRQNDQTVVNP